MSYFNLIHWMCVNMMWEFAIQLIENYFDFGILWMYSMYWIMIIVWIIWIIYDVFLNLWMHAYLFDDYLIYGWYVKFWCISLRMTE